MTREQTIQLTNAHAIALALDIEDIVARERVRTMLRVIDAEFCDSELVDDIENADSNELLELYHAFADDIDPKILAMTPDEVREAAIGIKFAMQNGLYDEPSN